MEKGTRTQKKKTKNIRTNKHLMVDGVFYLFILLTLAININDKRYVTLIIIIFVSFVNHDAYRMNNCPCNYLMN